MRKTLLTSVAVMGLAFAPAAFAQTGATQSPPSPNASSQMPQPTNSAPAGAAIPAPQAAPSGPLGGTITTGPRVAPAGAAPSGIAPAATASAPVRHPARPMHRRPVMHPAPATQSMAEPAPGDQSAPPTSAYRGGVGSPLSTQATDLRPSNGEKMGSRLPTPATAGETPRDLLAAAQNALNHGQTGAAQQALEMAETRVLSRTTDPSIANQPDQARMVQNISAARQALGARDIRGAKAAIASAMDDRVPGPGPAVVTRPAAM